MLSWLFGLGLPAAHAAMLKCVLQEGSVRANSIRVHSPSNSPQKIAFGHRDYGVVELWSDTAPEVHFVKQEAIGAAVSQCCGCHLCPGLSSSISGLE